MASGKPLRKGEEGTLRREGERGWEGFPEAWVGLAGVGQKGQRAEGRRRRSGARGHMGQGAPGEWEQDKEHRMSLRTDCPFAGLSVFELRRHPLANTVPSFTSV